MLHDSTMDKFWGGKYTPPFHWFLHHPPKDNDKVSSYSPPLHLREYFPLFLKKINPSPLTSHKDLLPCVPIIPVSLTDER